MSLGHDRPGVKQLTAYDPVAKWTCAQPFRRSTAFNAAEFLGKLVRDLPFPVRGIQVDGGSEFKAGFEAECRRRGIALWALPPRSPQLNGGVERVNGSWRREFHECWDLHRDDLRSLNLWADAFAEEFNTYRPHEALDGLTPEEYFRQLPADETPASQMS